jgi:alpha-N-arabinofuranosidase
MRCIHRRAVALASVLGGLLAAAGDAAEPSSLLPPVYLPDGLEFKTWEIPLRFSQTFYVTPSHARASDDNPGTEERPFRTIGRAAGELRPGQRVVIAAGTYRERVRPLRGGTGPDRMISYEAAPGADVILSGSQIVTAKWSRSGHGVQGDSPAVWTTTLSNGLFADENPFAEVNLSDAQIDRCMDWAIPTKGKVPNTLRRGLVFQDGERLRQVPSPQDLVKAPGTYWVEGDGLSIHVRPRGDADPNRARFEVTVRGSVFEPESFGLGYIRVKGLSIEQVGNGFPRPQRGALSARRGHHWIIEDNTIRQCNAIGIDIGNQFDTAGPELAQGGQHIVRRNTVVDCGVGGIEGVGIAHTLIEENVIRRCGWQDCWLIYETGGIKVHCTRSSLLRRNLVTDTTGAPGIWMDYTNVNSRCTGNVIVNAQCDNGGIFMEASQAPNLVDTNFVWGTQGTGIYQHDCDELTVAHNLVGRSTGAGVRMQVCQGRIVAGRLSTARRNKILNNVLIDNGVPLAVSDPDNVIDYNLFAAGMKQPLQAKPFDLAAWQKAHGWDEHSLVARVRAELNPGTLEFTWSAESPIPAVPRLDRVRGDFWRRPFAAATVPPGPFGAVPREPMPIELGGKDWGR